MRPAVAPVHVNYFPGVGEVQIGERMFSVLNSQCRYLQPDHCEKVVRWHMEEEQLEEVETAPIGAIPDDSPPSAPVVEMSEWIREFSDFKILPPGVSLGIGRFSQVFAATDARDGKVVAFKRFRSCQLDEAARQNFHREVSIMAKMKGETILQFLGYVPFDQTSTNPPSIITELMPNHSLKDLIEKKVDVPAIWDDTQKMIVLYGVAVGMRFLHENQVLHRDLKPENVLLNEAWEPKIADFGFSKEQQSENNQTFNIGTQAYMAPEMFEETEDYSSPVDVYAYAILANSVLSDEAPFPLPDKQGAFGLVKQVIQGKRPTIRDHVDSAWKDLIRQCWAGSPADRPPFAKIVRELSQPRFLRPIDVARFLKYQQRIGIEATLLAEAENLLGIRTPDQAEKIGYFRSSMKHGSTDGMLNYGVATGEVGPIEEAKNRGNVRAISHYADRLEGEAAAELYREGAEKGDARAQAKWGHLCELAGKVDEAAKNYKLAADQDDPDGLFAYGSCLAAGTYVPRDLPAAVGCFKRAADQDHARAQYLYGRHVAQADPTKAAEYYRRAAAQGDADAQFHFANTLTNDPEQAAHWYRKSAEQGNLRGQTAFGFCLERGLGVPAQPEEAVKLYRQAADRGDARAQCNYACCLARGIGVAPDPEKAARYFKFSADRRDPRGQVYYGECREQGIGIPQDLVKAADYFRRAADQGDNHGEFRFARCLAKGIGVETDLVMAAEYYRRAADRGNAAAQCNYGCCLLRGEGVSKDPAMAAHYFKQSADNKNPHGQANFGYCLEVGLGIDRDLVKSVNYYRLSSEQGDQIGEAGLRRSRRHSD